LNLLEIITPFNPDIKMVRDKILMQGHDCCNHRYLPGYSTFGTRRGLIRLNRFDQSLKGVLRGAENQELS
jgi:hypothetical protein